MLRIAITISSEDLSDYIAALIWEANSSHAENDPSKFPAELKDYESLGVDLLVWNEPVVDVESEESFIAAVVLGDNIELYRYEEEARRHFYMLATDLAEEEDDALYRAMQAEDRERTLRPPVSSDVPEEGYDNTGHLY